jgi:transcriptional regulator with XRE-family HTH domain
MGEQTLGQWLAARRNALGHSLRDVERITLGKVSNAALSQIETGRIESPSAITLHRLAAAYGLDFGETLTRAGDPNAPEAAPVCPTCGRAFL